MTQDKPRLPEFLDRSFARFRTYPTENIEASCEKVLSRLRAEPRTAGAIESYPAPVRSPRRWFAFATVAASICALLGLAWAGWIGWIGSERVGTVAEKTEAAGSHEILLPDGSRLEVRSQSEVSWMSSDTGITIHLTTGTVIVNAARQPDGRRLQVQSEDLTVTVVGTVFLVEVERQGSRVAVIEGEVRVRQGETELALHPGEQFKTSPVMESLPIQDQISWSREAIARLALLQREIAPKPIPAERSSTPSQPAFEVSTIKRTLASETGNGSMTTFPAGGFRKTNATVKDLIRTAYGLQEFQISGGPGWASKEAFEVEAKAEGKPSREQILLMIQNMLAERFKLKVRITTEELSVYALVPVKGGAKLKAVPESESEPVTARINSYDGKKTLSRFAEYLSGIVGQTVVDRTGLTGFYEIHLKFTPEHLRERFGELDDPSLYTALQEQLGLKLELSKAPVPYLVIESVEKPSPN